MVVTEKIGEKTRTRLIVPVLLIFLSLGGGILAFVAAVNLTGQQPTTPLLKQGTYVPAQVVFKIKSGTDSVGVANKALSGRQTVYREKTTNKLYAKNDSRVAKNPKNFSRTSLAIHLKNQKQLFPKVKLSEEVRNKILSRTGAKDPEKLYEEMGLDRWYVAEVQEKDADVSQLIQKLKSDTAGVEAAEANYLAKTKQLVSDEEPAPAVAEPLPSPVVSAPTTCSNPNDPYSCTFGHIIGGTDDQWWLESIKARQAWEISRGSRNTIVAVIDTGVDTKQADLKNKIWLNIPEDINHNGCADYWPSYQTQNDCHGTNITGDIDSFDQDGNGYIDDVNGMDFYYEQTHFRNNNPNQGPADTFGHGTAVAGVVGAETNSIVPEGVAGTCPECTIMPIRAGSSIGQLTTGAIAGAIYYAAMNGADVINMSFGQGEMNSAVDSAIDAADRVGAILVAASGNDNHELLPTTNFLATNSTVIAVGATNDSGERMFFAAGARCGSNISISPLGSSWGNSLSIVAPGVNIMTTMGFDSGGGMLCANSTCSVPSKDDVCGIAQADGATRSGYFYETGTSFAAPIVTGIVGLMRSINPALVEYDIRHILESTAGDLTDTVNESGASVGGLFGWDKYTGYGLVNAEAAVREAYNSRPDFAVTATPGVSPIIASGPNQLHLDFFIENRGRTTAENVPYRLINTDTNATYFDGRTRTIYMNSTSSLYETITVPTPIPSHLKLVIDPDNIYPEPFETDNQSGSITILPYGTPILSAVPIQKANVATTVSFTVTATDPNTDPTQLSYTATNLPTGATFTGQQFSWTPETSLPTQAFKPTFTVSDGSLASTREVIIEITNPDDASNPAPVLNGFHVGYAPDTLVEIDLSSSLEVRSIFHYGLLNADEKFYIAHDGNYSMFPKGLFTVEPNTTYHYRVEACTRAGRCITSPDQTFTTPTKPIISNISSLGDPNASALYLGWHTNTSSDSFIKKFEPVFEDVTILPKVAGGPTISHIEFHQVDLSHFNVSWETNVSTDGSLVSWTTRINKQTTSVPNGLVHTASLTALPNTDEMGLFEITACAYDAVTGKICTTSPQYNYYPYKNISSNTTNHIATLIAYPDVKYSYQIYTCIPGNAWCSQESAIAEMPTFIKIKEIPNPQIITPGQQLTFTLDTIVSKPGTPIIFTAENLPRGAVFERNSAVFSWATTVADSTMNLPPKNVTFRACKIVAPTEFSNCSVDYSIQIKVEYPEITAHSPTEVFKAYVGWPFKINDIASYFIVPDSVSIARYTVTTSPARLPANSVVVTNGALVWEAPVLVTRQPYYGYDISLDVGAYDNFGRRVPAISFNVNIYNEIPPNFTCPAGYSAVLRSASGVSGFSTNSCSGTEYALLQPYGSGPVCRSNTTSKQTILSTKNSSACSAPPTPAMNLLPRYPLSGPVSGTPKPGASRF